MPRLDPLNRHHGAFPYESDLPYVHADKNDTAVVGEQMYVCTSAYGHSDPGPDADPELRRRVLTVRRLGHRRSAWKPSPTPEGEENLPRWDVTDRNAEPGGR